MSKFNSERRTLLKGAAVTGAAASMPLTASAAIKPLVDDLQRSEFPMPDFASVTGDSVSLYCPQGIKHHAEIEEVAEIPFNCSTHVRPKYLRACAKVVRFKVAGDAELEGDVYSVSHKKLGKMDLLMSVVPDASGELALEAVFN